MKTIVIYRSKTGFTEKYAEWIAKKLHCDAVSVAEMRNFQYAGYDTIIYGGGLMAGRVGGLGKLKKDPQLAGKKLIVFATGATAQGADETVKQIKKENFTEEEQRAIPFFYFESGINYEKMGIAPKMLLKGIQKSLAKKNLLTEVETGFMHALEESADHSDIRHIEPLLNCISSI